MLSSKSWMAEASGTRPNTSPARAEAIAAGVRQMLVGDHLRAAGGVVGGDDLDAGQRPQKPLALREPLRMRIDAAQIAEGDARQRQQMVHDRQLHLADDREMMLDEQVVVAVDAAANRVLDRQDAVAGGPGVDGAEDLLEAPARDQLGVGVHQPRRRFAEGAELPLVGDPHTRLDRPAS